LEILAGQAGAGFFCKRDTRNSAEVLEAAIKEAHLQQFDIVIADTAGRLHVDDDLMDELALIRDVGSPVETLLVLDGLSGQDAINVAVEFQKKIGYTGGIITKMDGDSRGGAALSFRAVTDKPVKFLGTGETVKGLERMDPQRLAGRILGMGDVLGLVEKAQGEWDIEEAAKLEKKIRSNSFTLDDFAGEIRKISKLGSLSDLMNMLPANMRPSGMNIDPSQLTRMEAIINSMTPRERVHPELINGSRRKRIARGSGTSVRDVNRLLSEFRTMKTMMKRIKGGKGMNFPGIFG
ncbi:MAG: signal recognition particle protein, partial [FCB group bacterium]|nr:signal recognition particle protein [FCB group bacterium]